MEKFLFFFCGLLEVLEGLHARFLLLAFSFFFCNQGSADGTRHEGLKKKKKDVIGIIRCHKVL